MIDPRIISDMLVEISESCNYFIVTGSCSDIYNIGYMDIDDIDLIFEKNSFNLCNSLIEKFNPICSLTHKKDGHLLNRYLYKNIQIDILVKSFTQIDVNTIDVKLSENVTIKNCDSKTRYYQLINHNYKQSLNNYDHKIKKVKERILLYEKILFPDSRNDA